MVLRPIELPTEQTLGNLDRISQTHSDPAVRTIALVLLKLCPTVQNIAATLPGISAGNVVVSLDPLDQPKLPK
jgi:hypothetical protein